MEYSAYAGTGPAAAPPLEDELAVRVAEAPLPVLEAPVAWGVRETEMETEGPLHWYESPRIMLFFWALLKGVQSNKLEVESTLTPPLMDCRLGKVALSKLPTKSMAPPMLLRLLKPSMAARMELFAIWKPPPMVCSRGKEALVSWELDTIAKEPPMKPKLGQSMAEMVLLVKDRVELTVVMLGREIKLASRMVMLLAQIKSGKVT